MDELEQRYQTLHQNYETLIASGDPGSVRQIESLNKQLSDVLAEMLEKVASVRDNVGNIETYRNDLSKRLVRIQQDYNGLAVSHDKIETLRRIRDDQKTNFDTAFFWYALFLIIACILLFFALVISGGQRVAANPAMMNTPSNMPPFTYRPV
jgi:uncharacterized protein YdaL